MTQNQFTAFDRHALRQVVGYPRNFSNLGRGSPSEGQQGPKMSKHQDKEKSRFTHPLK